ncbi:hypothetical protein ACPA9J_01700 [Pseudomonas aeruginosa]
MTSEAGTTQTATPRWSPTPASFDAIARLKPVDATTNPSLLLKAAALPLRRAPSTGYRG